MDIVGKYTVLIQCICWIDRLLLAVNHFGNLFDVLHYCHPLFHSFLLRFLRFLIRLYSVASFIGLIDCSLLFGHYICTGQVVVCLLSFHRSVFMFSVLLLIFTFDRSALSDWLSSLCKANDCISYYVFLTADCSLDFFTRMSFRETFACFAPDNPTRFWILHSSNLMGLHRFALF